MANSAQAKKRIRQGEKARVRNTAQRSALRTAIKKVLKGVEQKESNIRDQFVATVKVIDSTASKGIIHPNKAARLKSRLNKKLKALV